MGLYRELIKWSSTGQSQTEQFICEIAGEGNIVEVKGYVIQKIIDMRNKSPYGEKINVRVYSNDTYYLYYKYHSSSAGYTEFHEDNDNLVPTLKSHEGFCFPAFTSEVVIFSKSKILQFTR